MIDSLLAIITVVLMGVMVPRAWLLLNFVVERLRSFLRRFSL